MRLERNRYQLENGLIIILGKEIVLKYGLNKREELSEKEYYEVLELATLSTSYYYLSKRDYSKKELYTKLYQKYRERKIILKVIENLEQKGLIDDYSFALNYASHKKGSRKKVEYNLFMKGISREIIDEVMLEFDDSEELEKEWNKLKGKELNKRVASLMRKGYSYEKIKRLIK